MTINGATTHLIINHFPVIAFPIVLFAFLWAQSRDERAVTVFAIYLYLIAWVTTALAYFTGDGAEHVLKRFAGLDLSPIEAHETAALVCLILSCIVAPLALAQLEVLHLRLNFLKSNQSRVWARRLFLFGLMALVVGITVTAHLGGLIRHAELR